MKVHLISSTPNPLRLIYTACRTCYSPTPPSRIYYQDVTREEALRIINDAVESGHHSVLEHCVFTFSLEGVSRGFSHQFVRHRHISPSQQSQRYVRYEDINFDYIPPTVDDDVEGVYSGFLHQAFDHYRYLVDHDVGAEDARMVLPNATPTNIFVTINLRELIHICHIRLCKHAQAEFREVVSLMVKEVLKLIPEFKSYLVPECEYLGYCPQKREPKGCRRPTKEKLLEVYEEHKKE